MKGKAALERHINLAFYAKKNAYEHGYTTIITTTQLQISVRII